MLIEPNPERQLLNIGCDVRAESRLNKDDRFLPSYKAITPRLGANGLGIGD